MHGTCRSHGTHGAQSPWSDSCHAPRVGSSNCRSRRWREAQHLRPSCCRHAGHRLASSGHRHDCWTCRLLLVIAVYHQTPIFGDRWWRHARLLRQQLCLHVWMQLHHAVSEGAGLSLSAPAMRIPVVAKPVRSKVTRETSRPLHHRRLLHLRGRHLGRGEERSGRCCRRQKRRHSSRGHWHHRSRLDLSDALSNHSALLLHRG